MKLSPPRLFQSCTTCHSLGELLCLTILFLLDGAEGAQGGHPLDAIGGTPSSSR